MTQRDAAEKMGTSERLVGELLRRMRPEGDGAAVHGLGGKVSNRKIPAAAKAQAIVVPLPPEWHGFGPSFASEQLANQATISAMKRCGAG